MHFVYILYSLKDHKLYKGYTSNVQNRFAKHNSGGSKSTSHRRPFVLIHIEQFATKTEALKKENYFKTLEGGSALKSQLIEKGILNKDGKLNMEQR
jgi:putative endonuclease